MSDLDIMMIFLMLCSGLGIILWLFSRLIDFTKEEEIKKEIEEIEKKIRKLKMRLLVLHALQRITKEEVDDNG